MSTDARSFLDSIAGFVDESSDETTPSSADRPNLLGTIPASYVSGNPTVRFDGESTTGARTYITLVPVKANDRVVLIPVGSTYVIIAAFASAAPTSSLAFENMLVNGTLAINQRAYASAGVLASGAYGFDRWKATTASSSMTFTAAPQGQIVTINSGGSFAQIVERENLPAGIYTFAWEGTATGRVYNVGATAPAYASSPVTVTLDGLANVTVEVAAVGATKTFGNARLVAGSVAGIIQRRTKGDELLLCQRYYVRWVAAQSEHPIGNGFQVVTTYSRIIVPLPCEMRVPPTVTYSGLEVSNNNSFRTVVTSWQSTPRMAAASLFLAPVHAAVGAGLGPLVLELTTTGTSYMEASAEL